MATEATGYRQEALPVYRYYAACGMKVPDLLCLFPDVADSRPRPPPRPPPPILHPRVCSRLRSCPRSRSRLRSRLHCYPCFRSRSRPCYLPRIVLFRSAHSGSRPTAVPVSITAPIPDRIPDPIRSFQSFGPYSPLGKRRMSTHNSFAIDRERRDLLKGLEGGYIQGSWFEECRRSKERRGGKRKMEDRST